MSYTTLSTWCMIAGIDCLKNGGTTERYFGCVAYASLVWCKQTLPKEVKNGVVNGSSVFMPTPRHVDLLCVEMAGAR